MFTGAANTNADSNRSASFKTEWMVLRGWGLVNLIHLLTSHLLGIRLPSARRESYHVIPAVLTCEVLDKPNETVESFLSLIKLSNKFSIMKK